MNESINKSSKLRSEYLEMDDEDDEMDETKRKSRNLSEKKRRDQFNMLINELNSIISVNGRKMDKSTILKAAMNTLKTYSENVARSLEYEIDEEWKPSFLTNEEYTYLMSETLGGFILVFSSCGKILYASSGLAAGLGYMLNEILNLSIYDLVTENDRSYLENMFFISTVNSLCMQNEDHPINFKCHFLRKSSKSAGDLMYEPVEFLGKIKPQEIQNCPVDQDKILDFNKPSIFVGFIRLLTPQLYNDVILHDHSKTEFISHHNFEWKFLFLDERAPSVIGYSPFEVLGTSGYDYYHIDDLDDIISHHKTLMVQDEGVSGFYRFLTKGHQWVWLQTSSYITRRQWNSRIEFVVCTHRVINPLNAGPRNTEDNETKMLDCSTQDCTPSFSSNGSTSCSTKTSPPSWQSTTSTTSDSNYCEEEDKEERSLLRPRDKILSYNNRTVSGASSRNLYYHKRKSTRKFHHLDKTYSEYPGNSSDTSSSNSNGYHATTGTAQIVSSATPNIKNEQECKVKNIDSNASLEICLQQKCDELQQIIAERQEELRVVSEQLFLARCNSSRKEDVNSSGNVISPGLHFSEHTPMEHSSSDGSLKSYSYENRPL